MGIHSSYLLPDPYGGQFASASMWIEDDNTIRCFFDHVKHSGNYTRETTVYDVTKDDEYTYLGHIVQRPGLSNPMGYFKWYRVDSQRVVGFNHTDHSNLLGISPSYSGSNAYLIEDVVEAAGAGLEMGYAGIGGTGMGWGGYGQSYGRNLFPYAYYPYYNGGTYALLVPNYKTPQACRVSDTDWIFFHASGDTEDATGDGITNFFAVQFRIVGDTISIVNDSGRPEVIHWNASVIGHTDFVPYRNSRPVYDNGYVYYYTQDRAGATLEVSINASTAQQSVAAITDMSRYEHEKMRLYWEDTSTRDAYIDLYDTETIAPAQINSKSVYSINSSAPPVGYASEFTVPTLFGWSKTSYSTQAYAFGTTDITVTPHPLLEGTYKDVQFTWEHHLPPTPPEVGAGWTGPKWRYAIEYTTTTNASWVQATTSTTLNGTYTITVDGLTGVRMRVADAEATLGQPAFSSTSPYATFSFPTYSNTAWGEVHAYTNDGESKTGAVDVGLSGYGLFTVESSWPVGHSNFKQIKNFGLFAELLYPDPRIISWNYIPYNADDQPPLKMHQRDDGLGPQGGPGRIGYYGRNGSRSIRLPLGGAW